MKESTRCALLAGLLLAGAPWVVVKAGAPDIILHNANIVTVNRAFALAEAVAIKAGRFVSVSNDHAVLQMAGPETVVVDMQGRTILPGFADTHVHAVRAGIRLAYEVDLTEVASIADIQSAIAARVSSAERGEWIFGSRGWWEYELAEGRLPTRNDLDAVSPDNPVVIPGPHYGIANSAALDAAGYHRGSSDPMGGRLIRDEGGELTGQLFNRATLPFDQYRPEPAREAQLGGVREILRRMNSAGLTSIREPHCTKHMESLLRTLYERGQMTIRMDCAFGIDANTPIEELDAALDALGPPGQRWGDGMFRADGLGEVNIDGAERTGLMRRDYPFEAGWRGLERVEHEQFKQFALHAARRGWRLGPHVVGDAAIDRALNAYAFVNGKVQIKDRRWMLDHAFLLMPDHYAKVHELGLLVNSQYMHNYQLGALILEAWERPKADMMQRYADWVANGIVFANGSDGPVSYHAQPLLQIYGSVTRNTAWGGSLGPEQGLSRSDAIRSVTLNGAYTSFEENVKGSIEPGKYADLVVLSDDVLAIDARRIGEIEVMATMLGGVVVHGSLDAR